MPCNSPRLDLLAFIHGELDASQTAELELHLAACPLCADEVAQLREEVDRLKKFMSLPLPDGLEDACLRRIERETVRARLGPVVFPHNFRPLRAIALAAASLALAFTGLSVISPPAYAMVVSGVARIGSHVTDLASQHIPAYDTAIRILAGLKAFVGL